MLHYLVKQVNRYGTMLYHEPYIHNRYGSPLTKSLLLQFDTKLYSIYVVIFKSHNLNERISPLINIKYAANSISSLLKVFFFMKKLQEETASITSLTLTQIVLNITVHIW